MIVYEVSLWVQPGVLAEFRAWLDDHVRELLALPGFTDATILDVVEPALDAATASASAGLCVHYRLRDEAALASYLREHAPRLRAAGMARFGGKFRAERRVMRMVAAHAATRPGPGG